MDGFIAFVIGIAVAFAVGVVFLFNVVDDDLWNESVNGCYVHEVHENHFGPDTVTITELCPTN